jgi:dephospho-CoA kinase
MKVFGLTGGIGMGKSTAAGLLRHRGLPIVDTDQIAREITEPGQPAVAEILAQFGEQFVDEDGHLDRAKLARKIFSDTAAREKLEMITHPKIRALWLAQIDAWRRESRPVAVVIIPLLFETAARAHFDETICVACSAATQLQRLLARRWTREHIEQRIKAQMPIAQKMLLADYVVWTEASLDVHAEQLNRIIPTA